jgi:glyoxylase-like metal-dependent hydrolase (beta-lactamase superfamily II)
VGTKHQVGDVSVSRIEEMMGPFFDPNFLFADWQPQAAEEHKAWMIPNHFSPEANKLCLSIHSWVLTTPHHTILVDACSGNDKNRPSMPPMHKQSGPWLERLAAAGVKPEQVDYVLCTHMHIDHVGWNTRLMNGRWVPTFPNAKYVFSKQERDFWDPKASGGKNDADTQEIYNDSVLPIIEAKQDMQIDGTHQLGDGLLIEPAPGHTPGHVTLKLRSKNEEALFSADTMHHPIQVWNPHWNSGFCADGGQARATRRRLLEHCAENNSLMLPAHFATPHTGRVKRRGDTFSFVFEA